MRRAEREVHLTSNFVNVSVSGSKTPTNEWSAAGANTTRPSFASAPPLNCASPPAGTSVNAFVAGSNTPTAADVSGAKITRPSHTVTPSPPNLVVIASRPAASTDPYASDARAEVARAHRSATSRAARHRRRQSIASVAGRASGVIECHQPRIFFV
jgi:hypothetical protein